MRKLWWWEQYLCVFVVLKKVQHLTDIVYVVGSGEEFKGIDSLFPKTKFNSLRQPIFRGYISNPHKMITYLRLIHLLQHLLIHSLCRLKIIGN